VAKKSYTSLSIGQVNYFFQHFFIGTVVKEKTVNKIIPHQHSKKILGLLITQTKLIALKKMRLRKLAFYTGILR